VLSWRLGVVPTELTFPAAVAEALYVAGVILAILCILLNVCRARGLAEVHFHWSPDANAVLRRYLRTVTALVFPLVFLVVLTNRQSQILEVSSLGRLLLILALAVVTVFCGLLFRPNGPLGKRWYRTREGMLFRLRYIWYAATVLMPLAMMVLAWVGYYSLALRLTWEMTISSWFIVALLLLNGLMLRWLTVLFYTVTTRRQRRAGATPEDSGLDVDVTSLREQSRQVLRFVMGAVLILGLWGIWSDSLPTLRRVGRVPLWNAPKTVTVETADKDGRPVPETEVRMEPVTVGDVIVAGLILVLTFIAARSASGLLRVLILRRLTMDKGAKYAVTVLLRYTIAVVGVVISLSLLGLRWGSIQWLVAAMTVGLGFGLQEIFANVVSGLIILFERPIRIGDTVTVGDTVGTVTKLRIRATTIMDWDCKELIVPNREFVTNRLVNWTLSDKILRVILRVGIAYGSDTELAERLLHEVAEGQNLILKTPGPIVLFTGFGDNALNFELRVYIRGIDSYLKVWHETNMAIDKAFRENNITIAFPQRDTHLNTTSPLDIRILPPDETPKPKPGH
jgi:potassium efflux system protein